MAGVLKLPVYNLKNVAITLNTGLVADCTSLTITEGVQVIDRTAGSSLKEQGVINKSTRPNATIEGFNTANLAYADLVPGSKVTAFSVAPTQDGDNASFLESGFFTRHPISELYLGETSTGLNESDASKWTTQLLFDILYSHLDPTPIDED